MAAKELCAFLPWISNKIICICAHSWALAWTTLPKVGNLRLGKAQCVPRPVLNILCSHCRHHLAQLTGGTPLLLGGEGKKQTGRTMPSLIQQSHGKKWSNWSCRDLGIHLHEQKNPFPYWWGQTVKSWVLMTSHVNKVLLSSHWSFTRYPKEGSRTPPKILYKYAQKKICEENTTLKIIPSVKLAMRWGQMKLRCWILEQW